MAVKTTRPHELTKEQIKRRSLQIGAGPKNDIYLHDGAEMKMGSVESYDAGRQSYIDNLRGRIDRGSISIYPSINPISIMREAENYPMSAASMSREACAIIKSGHHSRVHEMLVVAYYIALKFALHDRCFALLALGIDDARYTRGVPEDLIRKNLLHYLFVYIFYQSGLESRDRAMQYAQSLQYYFDLGTPPAEIDQLLQKYGQNELRKAAQHRANILAGARQWVEQGGDPSSVTMEEILLTRAKEKENNRATKKIDDSTDGQVSQAPTGDQRFKSQVDEISGDAEWLEANDPARNPNASYWDDHDQPDFANNGTVSIEPHERAKMLSDEMLASTARMVVKIVNLSIDDLEKDAMIALVRQSWVKLMMLRVRLDGPQTAPLGADAAEE